MYNMGKSAFVRIFGVSPFIKTIDFFLCEGRTWEYTITDVSKHTKIARATLYKIFERLLKLRLIKKTKKVGTAQLYRLNEDEPFVKTLTLSAGSLLPKGRR